MLYDHYIWFRHMLLRGHDRYDLLEAVRKVEAGMVEQVDTAGLNPVLKGAGSNPASSTNTDQ